MTAFATFLSPSRRRAAVVIGALSFLLAAAGACRASDLEGTPPAEFEAMVANRLVESQATWDADKLRALARQLNDLPASIACHALWQAAGAPQRFDTISLFVAALSSDSAEVRRQAGDLLVSFGTTDAMRMVYGHLDGERDPEVAKHIISGIASMPTRMAVRNLMEIMLRSGSQPAVIEAAAERLRQTTRARVSNNASAWRDWWLDNAHLYE